MTTLGQALSKAFSIPHHDTDDYYWLPTDPPFREKRPIPERIRLMEQMFLPRPAWILSGALESWGNGISDHFDLVVFVRTSTTVRLNRLRRREALRHGYAPDRGAAAVPPECEPFLRWAAEYDHGGLSLRSLQRHLIWLDQLSCPVLTVDGGLPTQVSVTAVKDALRQIETARARPSQVRACPPSVYPSTGALFTSRDTAARIEAPCPTERRSTYPDSPR